MLLLKKHPTLSHLLVDSSVLLAVRLLLRLKRVREGVNDAVMIVGWNLRIGMMVMLVLDVDDSAARLLDETRLCTYHVFGRPN